jgi:formyl-CoA transferase
MGAEVIKIEKPDGGDDSHRMGPPFVKGESAAFLAINRNKKSIVIDLKQEEGQELFKKMVLQVDVVAENFRPGTMDKLGLGYETLKKLNPALLYVAVSGFGQTGPYASRGGFDLVAQGMSGLMSVTGLPDSPPVKIGVPITDLNAGMYSAYGLLSAYIHRLKTGQGQMIDMSLLEGGIAYTFWESSELWNAGHVPEALGSAHRLSAPYQALPTADGYINLGVANQPNWERFCKVAGLDDLMEDPRFAINSERVQRYQELASLLEKTTRVKSTAEWLALLEGVGVPAGPINNLEQVYNDPHVLARGMVQELEHPVAGVTKHIGVPVKLSETPGQLRTPAPTLGQHTDEVLTNFGYSPQEILKFRDTGIVK